MFSLIDFSGTKQYTILIARSNGANASEIVCFGLRYDLVVEASI